MHIKRISSAVVAAGPSAVAILDKEANRIPDHVRDRRQQNVLAQEWEKEHKPKLEKIHSKLPNFTMQWANRMRDDILSKSDSALKSLRESATVTATWIAKRLQAQGLIQTKEQTNPEALKIVQSKSKEKEPRK